MLCYVMLHYIHNYTCCKMCKFIHKYWSHYQQPVNFVSCQGAKKVIAIDNAARLTQYIDEQNIVLSKLSQSFEDDKSTKVSIIKLSENFTLTSLQVMCCSQRRSDILTRTALTYGYILKHSNRWHLSILVWLLIILTIPVKM